MIQKITPSVFAKQIPKFFFAKHYGIWNTIPLGAPDPVLGKINFFFKLFLNKFIIIISK